MWGTHTCRQVCCVLSVSWVVDGGEGTFPSWLGGRACELGLVGRGALQTQRVLLDPAALAPRAQLPRKKSLAQHTEARPPAADADPGERDTHRCGWRRSRRSTAQEAAGRGLEGTRQGPGLGTRGTGLGFPLPAPGLQGNSVPLFKAAHS